MNAVASDVTRLGPMSEDAVRRLHQPAEWHRLCRYRYDTGVAFPGAMRSGRCYVLEDACRYVFGDSVVESTAGYWELLPRGNYAFEVVGDVGAVLVMAWKLPFAVDAPVR